ncbi:hypothetical protein Bca52824_064870 [Brassica carinata]|uniref:Serine/threonine-protein phosphatase n=1 Tax=Brassica carinata TaxID=52824 RepID=A0A8X7U8M2_BRACI|nr:hypothetical protein Bca52824_064870 [Brassica carinata]
MADLNLWQFPPPYATSTTQTLCGHTLTAVYHRLILFGGVTSVPSGGSDNSLQCLTNSVYCLNSLTKKWTRSEPPSPRTNHAAVSCGDGVLIQGGIGPSGICNGDLHVLDMSSDTFKWKKVVVQEGMAPCPRYGHVMGLAGKKLVIFGGKKGVLLDDLLISGELLSSGPTVPSFLWRSPNTPWPPASDMNDGYKPNFSKEKLHDLVNKVISTLLRPQTWEPPVDRKFFLSFHELAELCFAAKQIIEQEPTVLQLYAPIKVFGDLHGQFGDLMRLFYEYGYPSRQGDISLYTSSILILIIAFYYFVFIFEDTYVYVSFVQVEYPKNIHLIRGNHEAEATNTVYGFLDECIERIVRVCQSVHRIYIFYFHLPLAALIEKKIFCVHGGIGSSVFTMKQITNIKRPVDMDCEYNYKVVKDLLCFCLLHINRSDPTAHDSILGIGVNERGPHVVSFGPDRVNAFCESNDIDMIIRGHECVLDGFERFAQGKLITVFSATNYCGKKVQNAVAILVIGRNLDVVPKLIHPLPPPISPSENVPDKAWIEVDRERPPTPIRGQRKPDFEQGSTS